MKNAMKQKRQFLGMFRVALEIMENSLCRASRNSTDDEMPSTHNFPKETIDIHKNTYLFYKI